jgi:hypothetical protein
MDLDSIYDPENKESDANRKLEHASFSNKDKSHSTRKTVQGSGDNEEIRKAYEETTKKIEKLLFAHCISPLPLEETEREKVLHLEVANEKELVKMMLGLGTRPEDRERNKPESRKKPERSRRPESQKARNQKE